MTAEASFIFTWESFLIFSVQYNEFQDNLWQNWFYSCMSVMDFHFSLARSIIGKCLKGEAAPMKVKGQNFEELLLVLIVLIIHPKWLNIVYLLFVLHCLTVSLERKKLFSFTLLIASAKSWSARGASHEPTFMIGCLTISHTCLPCLPNERTLLY